MKPEHKQYFLDLPEPKIMALCIWAEARDKASGREGRIAVGSVQLNRVDFGNLCDWWGRRYGKTIHTVIMAPSQFSWLNSDPPQKKTDPQYEKCVEIAKNFDRKAVKGLDECVEIAEGLLDGSIKRNVSSLYYHTLSVHPKWAEKLVRERVIGSHVFYKNIA